MKAVIIDQFGGPEHLILRELPTPAPGEGEVLLKVASVGVNFADTMIRSGGAGVPMTDNLIIGSEAAGTVVALGSGVDPVILGKRAFAAPFAVGRITGAYATHIALPANGIFLLPDDITFDQAVALGLSGIVALELSRLVPIEGRTVLVHSAAGGVGHLLAQLVALRSPGRLIGSVGHARKAELLNAIGVHSAVSTQGDWVGDLLALTDGAPPDVIFDAIGGAISRLGLSSLSIGGHFVAYGGASGEYAALSKEDMPSFVMSGKSLLGYSLVPLLGHKDAARYLRDDLDTLFSYVTQGVLRPHVGHHFPLHEAADAHRLIESRRSSGKIILLPEVGQNGMSV